MSNRYNYWCVDCNCENKEKHSSYRNFVIEKPESKEKRKEPCPNNPKLKLKLMGMLTYGGTTMSKEERIVSLKKRSKDHFNKEIKEKKEHMIRRFDTTGQQ